MSNALKSFQITQVFKTNIHGQTIKEEPDQEDSDSNQLEEEILEKKFSHDFKIKDDFLQMRNMIKSEIETVAHETKLISKISDAVKSPIKNFLINRM